MHDSTGKKREELYSRAPVAKTFFRNAIPAMISMLLVLAYNLADTFFVGQTGDVIQVAAVSICTPAFMLFQSLGSLFGIGGASSISRDLGSGNIERAKKTSSFCFWTGVAFGLAGIVIFSFFTPQILSAIGANEESAGYADSYLKIVGIGAPFIILSSTFSQIVRTEGKPTIAVVGMVIGNIMNIILDPLFILGLGAGVSGAAAATTISNVFSGAYYLVYFLRGHSSLSISSKDYSGSEGIAIDVLKIGIPGSLQSILMSVAGVLVNNILIAYSNYSVAAMGIAMKIDMVTSLLMIGMSQGIMPAIGYNYGAQNYKRAKSLIKFSIIMAALFGTCITVLCWVGAGDIIRAFINDDNVYAIGLRFVHCLLVTGPIVGIVFILGAVLQAMGYALPNLILSVTRQGLAYIPALFILNQLFGLNGIAFSLPIANLAALICSVVFYLHYSKKLQVGHNQEKTYMNIQTDD